MNKKIFEMNFPMLSFIHPVNAAHAFDFVVLTYVNYSFLSPYLSRSSYFFIYYFFVCIIIIKDENIVAHMSALIIYYHFFLSLSIQDSTHCSLSCLLV